MLVFGTVYECNFDNYTVKLEIAEFDNFITPALYVALGRGSGRILNLDGHLRRSIMSKSGKDFAMVGTNKIYAAIHNFGGTPSLKRNKNMPKREFMRLNDYAREELQSELYIAAKEMLIDKNINKNVYGK